MLSRRSFTLGAACAGLATAAPAADTSPTAFITAIYNSYKGKDAKGTPLDNERTIRRYFEPKLAAAMVKDQKTSKRRNEVGQLDFDPFLDAQDWEVETFDIAVTNPAAGKAQATVKFVNGDPMTVTLDLVQASNSWRIYDIAWLVGGKTDTLRKMFIH